VLILPRHLEVAEDQREHEQVVHRQALLEQPGGGELYAGVPAEGEPDDDGEHQRQPDPQGAPPGRFPETDDVGPPVRQQVDGEHDQDDGGERGPSPQRNSHREPGLPVIRARSRSSLARLSG